MSRVEEPNSIVSDDELVGGEGEWGRKSEERRARQGEFPPPSRDPEDGVALRRRSTLSLFLSPFSLSLSPPSPHLSTLTLRWLHHTMLHHFITTSIDINADPATIYSILTDLSRYHLSSPSSATPSQ
jgi:hypothetical protein